MGPSQPNSRDEYARRHGGTWHLFHQRYVATDALDEGLRRLAQRAQRSREGADYEAITPDPDEAEGLRRPVGGRSQLRSIWPRGLPAQSRCDPFPHFVRCAARPSGAASLRKQTPAQTGTEGDPDEQGRTQGRLTRDLELSDRSGTTICDMRLAVNGADRVRSTQCPVPPRCEPGLPQCGELPWWRELARPQLGRGLPSPPVKRESSSTSLGWADQGEAHRT